MSSSVFVSTFSLIWNPGLGDLLRRTPLRAGDEVDVHVSERVCTFECSSRLKGVDWGVTFTFTKSCNTKFCNRKGPSPMMKEWGDCSLNRDTGHNRLPDMYESNNLDFHHILNEYFVSPFAVQWRRVFTILVRYQKVQGKKGDGIPLQRFF